MCDALEHALLLWDACANQSSLRPHTTCHTAVTIAKIVLIPPPQAKNAASQPKIFHVCFLRLMCWCNTLPNWAEETGVSHQLWIHTRQTKIVLLHKYLLAVGRGSRHHLKHLYRYNGTGQLKHAKKNKGYCSHRYQQHSAFGRRANLPRESHTFFGSLDCWYAPSPAKPPNSRPAARDGTLPWIKNKAVSGRTERLTHRVSLHAKRKHFATLPF